MVIGQRFAWCHLPKTGGDATLTMFRAFPSLILRSDDTSTHAKHDTFADHEPEVIGKTLILNIRRLPAWMLSHAHTEAQGGLYPDYQPRPMPTAVEMSERQYADQMLSLFTADDRFAIDEWLRMENLAEDFLRCIESFGRVTPDQRRAVEVLGPVNTRKYDHSVEHWFTDDQIRTMYENNPRWAALERALY
jgi:hypothetical protein